MKRLLFCCFLAFAGLEFSFAQNPEKPAPPADAPKPEKPVKEPNRPMEKRTFLGVATGPLDPTLRAQLGIPRGTGITIHHVDKDSPAGNVLNEHDVVTKFNDQILVSHEQLAVLVENSKPGDNVSLTIIRGGKEQAVAVTLAEHEVPVRPEGFPNMGFQPWMVPGPGMNAPRGAMGGTDQQMREARERMHLHTDEMHRRMETNRDGQGSERGRPEPGRPEVDQNRRGSGREMHSSGIVRNSTWVQDQVTLNLIENPEGRNLTVTDAGKEVFRGPVNSDDEKAKVPAPYQDAFKRLESQLKPEPPKSPAPEGQVF